MRRGSSGSSPISQEMVLELRQRARARPAPQLLTDCRHDCTWKGCVSEALPHSPVRAGAQDVVVRQGGRLRRGRGLLRPRGLRPCATSSRRRVKKWPPAVERLSKSHPKLGLFVRPNSLATRLTGNDLEASVAPGLIGPVRAEGELRDRRHPVRHARRPLRGTQQEWPGSSTSSRSRRSTASRTAPRSPQASPRVGALIGPTAEHADIAKAVGYEWSPEGLESLYHRTRILLATRAADRHPLTALWERIHDLDGLRTFATQGRKMGFRGQVVLSPTHVPVVNQVYTPDAEADRLLPRPAGHLRRGGARAATGP